MRKAERRVRNRKNERSFKNRLEAILGMSVTMVFSLILVMIGPISHILDSILSNYSFADQVADYFPAVADKIRFIGHLKISGEIFSFLKSDVLHGGLTFVYFTFLYHWLFWFKEGYRRSIYGALAFSILFMLLKTFFWRYLSPFRQKLVSPP